MPEKLKDLFFTTSSMAKLREAIAQAYPAFDKKRFTALVFDATWDGKELKQKMRHVTECLHETLPADYPEALEILRQVAPSVSEPWSIYTPGRRTTTTTCGDWPAKAAGPPFPGLWLCPTSRKILRSFSPSSKS
jgi:hypothetical protein